MFGLFYYWSIRDTQITTLQMKIVFTKISYLLGLVATLYLSSTSAYADNFVMV
jgi:hypothetical protein